MKITQFATAILFASCCVCSSFAADQPDPQSTLQRSGIAKEKSTAKHDPAVAATPNTPVRGLVAAVNSEVFRDVLVTAGESAALDSILDFSSANTVAVTVQCIVCDSAGTSLGSSRLVLQARWAVPSAASFVATETQAATTFPYWDAGGAIFNVYGSQFRLIIQNKGSETIALQQVTIFHRSQ